MKVRKGNRGKPISDPQGLYLRHLIRADVRPCKLTMGMASDIIDLCQQSDDIEEVVGRFPELRAADWFSDSPYIVRKREKEATPPEEVSPGEVPREKLVVPNKVKFSQAIEILEKSGMSDAEFLEEIGASDKLLYAWRRKLARGEDGHVWSLNMNAEIISLIMAYNADTLVKKSIEISEIVTAYKDFAVTKQEVEIGAQAGLSVGDLLNMKTHRISWKMLEEDMLFARNRRDHTSLRGLLHFRMAMSELEDLKQVSQ